MCGSKALLLISVLALGAGCGSRVVPQGDGALVDPDQGRAPDGAGPADGAQRRDRAAADAAPSTFCSGNPRVEIGGVAQVVTELESGSTLTSCCEGEFLRFKTTGPVGPVTLTFTMLRFPGAVGGLLNMSLAQPPKGWTFTVTCEPYLACGYIHAGNSTLGGTLNLNPVPAPPAVGAALCLRATPLPGRPGIKPVRLWGSALINTQCTYGMDQTCNLNPLISAIYGKCNEDGTCSCNPGHVKDPPTGQCK